MFAISTTFAIGVFVALYPSVGSATPTAVTPNTPTLLVPRIPEDSLCGEMNWVLRECVPSKNPRAWQDVCVNTHFQLEIPGNCPDNTVCENIVNHDAETTIRCVSTSEPGTSKSRQSATDPQAGASNEFQAVTSLANTQFKFEVFVADDMLASVAAFVLSKFLLCLDIAIGADGDEGEDKEFVLEPNNIIVGKIAGKEITVCQGSQSDPLRARECYPTGRFNLHRGDAIDFSWGLSSGQIASLNYALWPSNF
jgi:hypothetical protein